MRHGPRQAAVLVTATMLVTAVLLVTAALGAGPATAAAPSAPQMLAASRHALASVASFTANGYILDGKARLGFLIHSTERGNAASGRFSSSSKSVFGFVGSYSFVRIGGTFYLDGDARFWLSAAPSSARSELTALSGKWIELPSSEVRSVATITGAMTNPSRMASLIGTDTAQADFQFGPTAILHGRRALTVRTSSELVYLVATVPHLPVEYVERTARSKTLVELGYPASLSIAAPPVSPS